MTKKALIVFLKQPDIGTVKTRLAASVGDEIALEVYRYLLKQSASIITPLKEELTVFVYSNTTHLLNDFEHLSDQVFLQKGEDLGEKMKSAFKDVFSLSFDQVVIMGTDCYELSSKHISEAFKALNYTDVTLGPAKDGGYYLLGLKNTNTSLFDGISWSTSNVLKQTLEKINKEQKDYFLLETLSDIDRIEDVEHYKWFKELKNELLTRN